MPRPYVVYCGRYSAQKNVPLLVEWGRRYQAQGAGRLDFVFIGQGEIALPAEDWLHELGRVDEAAKRRALAGAAALVQLSTYESLSLVALEAWAQGTPVIAHRDCAVLAGLIERSGGGALAGSETEFAELLDDLAANPATWRRRGEAGRSYLVTNYSSRDNYLATLDTAIVRLAMPIAGQMRLRGPERAAEFDRRHWQTRFAEFVESVLTQPARSGRGELIVEPLKSECRAASGSRTLLVPVRLRNTGARAAVGEGPGRSVICCEIRTADGDAIILPRAEMPLPGLLMPGKAHTVALPVAVPASAGTYRIALWTEAPGAVGPAVEMRLLVADGQAAKSAGCAANFLDAVQEMLPRTHRLAQLPADYVDVSEGRLAPVKRLVKRKLLNNFKHAYVDVLSRQQSQVNGQVVLMIQQLAECCGLLENAIAGLHQRIDRLEAKIEDADRSRLGVQEAPCER